MKKLLSITALLFVMAGVCQAFFMDFEEGLGHDQEDVVDIPGVEFVDSGGLPWIYSDITTDLYNAHSVNVGVEYGTGQYNMYGYVCAWLGITGDWGRINFEDHSGTYVEIGVSSFSDFTMEAYDADDNLLDSDTTGPCRRYADGYTDMVWLRVNAPGGTTIAYIKVYDTGNRWILDELQGDMPGGFANYFQRRRRSPQIACESNRPHRHRARRSSQRDRRSCQ